MKATRVNIRTGGGDPLPVAIALAPALVDPADGLRSYDARVVCWMDEHGRPARQQTAVAHVTYTFWRSARRGRYKLPSPAASMTAAAPPLWESI